MTLLIWVLIVAFPLLTVGGFLVLDPRPRQWLADRRSTRLAQQFIDAHERGDVAAADQMSAEARERRSQRRGGGRQS